MGSPLEGYPYLVFLHEQLLNTHILLDIQIHLQKGDRAVANLYFLPVLSITQQGNPEFLHIQMPLTIFPPN